MPSTPGSAQAFEFVAKLNEVFLFPLLALMSGIAFLFFLYGGAEYIMNADNESARNTGRSHMLYGLIGLAIMGSAYAILTIALNSFGLGDELKGYTK